MTRPAVFLDRDGVLNRILVREGRPHPPVSVEELEILPDVATALAAFKAAGLSVVVVTNQPDVARGLQRRDVVEAMHDLLARRLPIDEIRVCYHDDADNCRCRKPKADLITRAPVYDLARSVMVGDRWRDVEAGKRAGVGATILVSSGHDEPCAIEPDLRVSSLGQAVPFILNITCSTS